MSLNGDSCSTSSGCVSDLDTLSEDPSPDSPISDIISDSLHSSALKSLPNNEEFAEEMIITKTTILSVNPKVPEDEEEVDEAIGELLEEELIENEIIIDSSPVDSLSLNQILTANCYALEYQTIDEEQEDEGLVRDELPTDCYQTTLNASFGFSRSLNCSSKAETASIKSDSSSHTSGHESDGTTRQSSDSHHNSNNKLSVNSRPTLNGVFKELKDFKCLSQNRTHKSDDIQSNSSKTSTDDNSKSGDSSPYYCCKWTHCDWPGHKDDLVDHIREIHVELQPYQQQKHNWNEVQTKTANKSQTIFKPIDRRVTDSTSNASTKKVESTQQYVCLWEGCKVYGKGSSSRNWLERHVLEQHSGPRPFKCIVEDCGQRFKRQSALERHVNSHFKPSPFDCTNSNCSTDVCPNSGSNSCCANSSNNNSDSNQCHNSVHGLSPFELHLKQTSRATMSAFRSKTTSSTASVDNNSSSNCCPNHHLCTNGTPNKILKRKKSNQKVRRKCFYVKCSEDFFDECVMEQVRYGLIQLNAHTGLDISGNQSTVTFHSKVIARRENDSGEVNVLLKWEPNDILPDVWVPEDKVSELKSKTVPVSTLSQDCLAQLIEQNNGFERKPKIKQRRK